VCAIGQAQEEIQIASIAFIVILSMFLCNVKDYMPTFGMAGDSMGIDKFHTA
jgi:hypothetical protein